MFYCVMSSKTSFSSQSLVSATTKNVDKVKFVFKSTGFALAVPVSTNMETFV